VRKDLVRIEAVVVITYALVVKALDIFRFYKRRWRPIKIEVFDNVVKIFLTAVKGIKLQKKRLAKSQYWQLAYLATSPKSNGPDIAWRVYLLNLWV